MTSPTQSNDAIPRSAVIPVTPPHTDRITPLPVARLNSSQSSLQQTSEDAGCYTILCSWVSSVIETICSWLAMLPFIGCCCKRTQHPPQPPENVTSPAVAGLPNTPVMPPPADDVSHLPTPTAPIVLQPVLEEERPHTPITPPPADEVSHLPTATPPIVLQPVLEEERPHTPVTPSQLVPVPIFPLPPREEVNPLKRLEEAVRKLTEKVGILLTGGADTLLTKENWGECQRELEQLATESGQILGAMEGPSTSTDYILNELLRCREALFLPAPQLVPVPISPLPPPEEANSLERLEEAVRELTEGVNTLLTKENRGAFQLQLELLERESSHVLGVVEGSRTSTDYILNGLIYCRETLFPPLLKEEAKQRGTDSSEECHPASPHSLIDDETQIRSPSALLSPPSVALFEDVLQLSQALHEIYKSSLSKSLPTKEMDEEITTKACSLRALQDQAKQRGLFRLSKRATQCITGLFNQCESTLRSLEVNKALASSPPSQNTTLLDTTKRELFPMILTEETPLPEESEEVQLQGFTERLALLNKPEHVSALLDLRRQISKYAQRKQFPQASEKGDQIRRLIQEASDRLKKIIKEAGLKKDS